MAKRQIKERNTRGQFADDGDNDKTDDGGMLGVNQSFVLK